MAPGRDREATRVRRGELRALFANPRFGRLLGTRLTSQASDGVFQTSLAGAVVFNPDHHTSATEVAVGFVILLLPYSVIGPYAGVLLDHWRRQRILTRGAIVRAGLVVVAAVLLATRGPADAGFAVAALAVLAVNRFYLAALSAALPHVLTDDELITGNALSPTAGTVATIIGGGIGLGVRTLAGSGDHGNAVVALIAAAGYLTAATISARLPAESLGPDGTAHSVRQGITTVAHGMVAGGRHLWHRRPAARALAVIIGQRFLFGLWTIMALLLYRNTFHSHGVLRAGLTGVGQAATVGGIGLVLGAVVTPRAVLRIGTTRWVVLVTAVVAVSELALGAPFSMALLLVSALVLGFTTQATKVCVDTTVQAWVEDEFRGRAFAIYDTVYNVSFVAAAAVAALTLPSSGKSVALLVAMSAAYFGIAVGYAISGRSLRGQTAEHTAEQSG